MRGWNDVLELRGAVEKIGTRYNTPRVFFLLDICVRYLYEEILLGYFINLWLYSKTT